MQRIVETYTPNIHGIINCSGSGFGDGYGFGFGYGDGSGSGSGSGSGDEYGFIVLRGN